MVITATVAVGKSRLGREALAVAEHYGALAQWVRATRERRGGPSGTIRAASAAAHPIEQMLTVLRAVSQSLDARRGRTIVMGVDDAQPLDPVSAALVLQLASAGTHS